MLDKDPEKAKQQMEEIAQKMREDLAAAALKALDFGSLVSDETNSYAYADLLTAVTEFMKLIKTDTIEEATKAWNDANMSGWDRYKKQLDDFNKLDYDGTADSFLKLVDATQALKQSQLDLAIAYMQTSKAAKEMFGDTAQSIRESTMTDEELYDTRQSQIQNLVAQMRDETDPTRLMDLATEINTLTRDAWGMLDEDQRGELQSGFLSFLDEVDAILQQRVGLGLDQLEQDSANVNAEASAKLAEAAEQFASSVNNFNDAVTRLGSYIGGGGNRNNTNEVVQLR